MVIDAHAHLVVTLGLQAYWTGLASAAGAHGKGRPRITEEARKAAADNNVGLMDKVGFDMQLISPRPYAMMHSHKPAVSVPWWIEAFNNEIAATVKLYPKRFRGVGGLPQISGEPVTVALEEFDRCIKDLKFVGVLVNPDPGEGDNKTPNMGQEYWYPLYEKACQLDVPIHIHSAGCNNGREYYAEHFLAEETLAVISMWKFKVFNNFPKLKVLVSHAGGAVPLQVGRWRSFAYGEGGASQGLGDFDEGMRKFWYDTAVWSKEGMECLFKVVGADRSLFGTEKPGSGSAVNPKTGKAYDEMMKPWIEEMDFLSAAEKKMILEDNARKLFKLDV
ncbi:MAG TPA: amidohydrolase family protein [Candidatus Binataceae bacterium]|nr:amidohydrolase family protein [Candidatus Binataceae bacterium]